MHKGLLIERRSSLQENFWSMPQDKILLLKKENERNDKDGITAGEELHSARSD